MWVWRHRYAELGAREDVDYVYIFENRGVEVGVTLHHPHGQIYGYPFLPPVPALELAADERLGGCAPCVLLERELERRARGCCSRTRRSSPTCPNAARWPYEAHRRDARAPPLSCSTASRRSCARWRSALQRLARGYDALFARPFPT